MGDDAFISLGYVIALPAEREGSMSEALLPARFVTMSDCLAPIVPAAWTLAWSSDSPAARAEAAESVGLGGPDREALIAWCTAAFDSAAIVWPGFFVDVGAALEARARFFASAPEARVYGLSLPRDLAGSFVGALAASGASGYADLSSIVTSRVGPAPAGRVLGFDVLGWDYGFHSYVCNSLETEFFGVLGVRPNASGLYDHLDDARRCAEHAGLPSTRAEPACWLPWRVAVYDGPDARRPSARPA